MAAFVACAGGFTGRVVNDPDRARAFSCTRSEPHPEYDACFVDRPQCEQYVSQERAVGAFVSECFEQATAFCFAGYERDAPVRVWECEKNAATCDLRREKALGAALLVDLGTCLEKRVQ